MALLGNKEFLGYIPAANGKKEKALGYIMGLRGRRRSDGIGY
jgi:hypothetical protein